MTIAEVKSILGMAIWAQRDLNRDIERLQVLRSQVERITPVISDMPKGGGELDRRGNMLAELIDMSSAYEQDWIKQQRIILYVLHVIDMLEDGLQRAVLEEHYVNGLEWQPVADKLGYSYSTVTNYHGIALQKLADVLTKDDTVVKKLTELVKKSKKK
jgi:DNA-directed RNA polymerase specialized sigma subunit